MRTVKEIEDAIIATLTASALGGICKSIKPYQCEIDVLLQELKRLTISLPASLVLYDGSKFTLAGTGVHLEDIAYSIVFVAKSLRGRDALRLGVYEMLELGKDVLENSNLGLDDIKPVRLIAVEPALITQEFSVYILGISTGFVRE